MFPTNSIQNSEAYWPRPSEFLPERFLPEGQEKLGPTTVHATMPFGAGTRMCPVRVLADVKQLRTKPNKPSMSLTLSVTVSCMYVAMAPIGFLLRFLSSQRERIQPRHVSWGAGSVRVADPLLRLFR